MNLNKSVLNITRINFKWQEIEINIEYFKEKVKAMLIWWSIWDALGIPVEMKSKEYIDKNYWRIEDFMDYRLNYFFSKWLWLKQIDGVVSDDTILTFAWVESILEKGRIKFDNLLKKSIKEYKKFPYWFWWWTRDAFAKYEFLEYELPSRENYIDLWDKNSAWNWVIMKQSPYAAYWVWKDLEQNDIDENIELITKLTHWHPIAIVASLVHNNFLMELLKSDWNIDFEELLNYLIEYSKEVEERLLEEWDDKISDLLENLLSDNKKWGLKSFDEILDKYWWWNKNETTVWKIENKFYKEFNKHWYGTKKIISSGYVVTTMWIVYSIFLNKQNMEWLLDWVNIWWDTDTFASIIWNMIWAYKWKFYTEYYEQWVNNSEKLNELSEKFWDLIIN